MRYILIFWAVPMALIWGWYGLSYHDANFGITFLSRDMHDLVFRLYGHILGIEPSAIPPLLARACIIDTGIVLAIFAFRRRRVIAAWLTRRRGGHDRAAAPRKLSSAP